MIQANVKTEVRLMKRRRMAGGAEENRLTAVSPVVNKASLTLP